MRQGWKVGQRAHRGASRGGWPIPEGCPARLVSFQKGCELNKRPGAWASPLASQRAAATVPSQGKVPPSAPLGLLACKAWKKVRGWRPVLASRQPFVRRRRRHCRSRRAAALAPTSPPPAAVTPITPGASAHGNGSRLPAGPCACCEHACGEGELASGTEDQRPCFFASLLTCGHPAWHAGCRWNQAAASGSAAAVHFSCPGGRSAAQAVHSGSCQRRWQQPSSASDSL